MNREEGSKGSEESSGPIRKFQFLRRGEGTKRFGRLGVPPTMQSRSKDNGIQPSTQQPSAPASTPREGAKDSGCEDIGSTSAVDSPGRGLSDTRQFEEWERQIQLSSIASDNSSQFARGLSLGNSANRQSSPVSASSESGTNSRATERSRESTQQSNASGSTRTNDSPSSYTGQIRRAVSTPRIPSPLAQQPSQPFSVPQHGTEELLEGRGNDLLSKVAMFDDALARVKAQENLLLEVAQNLRKDESRLRTEMEKFSKQKDEELNRLKGTEDELNRRKKILDKRETEQLKILREQVKDLQNDICERDAKISAMRSKQKDLETDNSSLKREVMDLKAETNRLKDRCVTVERANTQFRLKNGPKQFKPLSTAVKPRERRVTFNDKPDTSSPSQKDAEESDASIEQVPSTSELPNPETTSDLTVTQERTLSDGSSEKVLSNGTVLTETPGGVTIWRFLNGDTRRILQNGTQIYWYAATDCTLITEVDGTEKTKFRDGTEIITRPDGKITETSPNGKVDIKFPDGRRVIKDPATGIDKVFLADGGVELQNKAEGYSEREFEDGIKRCYADGSQITWYRDRRIRVKDAQGQLLYDSFTATSPQVTAS